MDLGDAGGLALLDTLPDVGREDDVRESCRSVAFEILPIAGSMMFL